jgi:hypothetical protein
MAVFSNIEGGNKGSVLGVVNVVGFVVVVVIGRGSLNPARGVESKEGRQNLWLCFEIGALALVGRSRRVFRREWAAVVFVLEGLRLLSGMSLGKEA